MIEKEKKISVERLCFGTSRFVAGKLDTNYDTNLGKAALETGLNCGIKYIHSNAKLGTQWAIRDCMTKLPHDVYNELRHIIKIETPPDANIELVDEIITKTIHRSKIELNTSHIWGVIYELDIKRVQNPIILLDKKLIEKNYTDAAQIIGRELPYAKKIALAHSSIHMKIAIRSSCFSGYAAHLNLLEPWPSLFLNEFGLTDKLFFALAPLRRGLLCEARLDEITSTRAIAHLKRCKQLSDPCESIENIGLRWVLSHPVVTATIISMRKPEHVYLAIEAAKKPLSIDVFHDILRSFEKFTTLN